VGERFREITSQSAKVLINSHRLRSNIGGRQLPSRLLEIDNTDDGVAPARTLGLVAGDLHGHRPRHAGALEVANRVCRRWYTPAEARNLFERLGKSGRNIYALTELTLDLVFPLIYGSLFCLLTASLARAQWAWLVTIPLFAALSDLVENSIVAYLAWSYAGQESSLAWLAAAVTLIKTLLLGLSLLILFAGGAYGLLLSSPPAAGR
jgi:hypothetical protein